MRKLIRVAVLIFAVIGMVLFRLILLALGSAAYVYLFPWIVAQKRGHPRQREILLVCALAGWLVIPWMGALWFARRTTGIAAIHTDPVLAWNAFDE
jgi:hypothetical protein